MRKWAKVLTGENILALLKGGALVLSAAAAVVEGVHGQLHKPR